MTNDRDPLSLALYPRSFAGTAFNSEPAYFTFISEPASLFVDEYTVEGSALKYEFVFEGEGREEGGEILLCKPHAALRRIVFFAFFARTKILCKPSFGRNDIYCRYSWRFGFAVIAHSIYVSFFLAPLVVTPSSFRRVIDLYVHISLIISKKIKYFRSQITSKKICSS